MPSYTPTLKHALRRLTGSNVISDIDAGIAALADDLDAIIAVADQGPASGRPTSTPGSPGKSGRLYWATDTAQLFFDHGTGWVVIYERDAWHVVGTGSEPAYENSWTTWGTPGNPPVGFRRVNGIVHLRGVTVRWTGPTSGRIFVLPAGYRPAQTMEFVVWSNATPSTMVAGVQIGTDGSVGPAPTQSIQQVHFDNVSFPADA